MEKLIIYILNNKTSNGILVSTVYNSLNKEYQTIAFDKHGEELDVLYSYEEKNAISIHNSTFFKYSKISNKIKEICEALINANNQAVMAGENEEDGGASNFDAVILNEKLTDKEALIISTLTNINISYKLGGLHKGSRFVYFFQKGQGHRSTRMAEAACNSLKQNNISASMFYQID